MDLFFEPTKGMPFCIEVGYFDTMQEIKEKVAKYQGIPVQEQTLIFKNKTLPDDLNIHTSDIFDRSRIQLLVNGTATEAPETTTTAATKVKTEENPSPPSSSSNQKIKILLKPFGVSMEFDMNDLVSKLKEKINEKEGVPLSRIIVNANGVELLDHRTLHECQLFDNSEVDVTFKPPTPPPTMNMNTNVTSGSSLNVSLMGNYSKKMKVNVMSKCGEKIVLEVNPLNNVGELRKELQKLRSQGVGFRLPAEGYFFIYKQNVMEEDQSFRWHRVAHGDTVEIFNGCVTGGS